MECYSCRENYNDCARAPKILPFCGHSLCLACLEKYYGNGKIECQECGTVTQMGSLNDFPMNFAVLNLSKKDQGGSEETQSLLCEKHFKKQEIFCYEDGIALC